LINSPFHDSSYQLDGIKFAKLKRVKENFMALRIQKVSSGEITASRNIVLLKVKIRTEFFQANPPDVKDLG
jgi:hypothetical protein